MPTTYIPDEDALVRYIKPSLVDRDPETSEVRGIFPAAFRLRPEDDSCLSSAWLEFYEGPRLDRIAASIAQFKVALAVKATAVFAIGNVAAVKAACQQYGVNVRVVHAPEDNHEAHSEVRRFVDSDDQLLLLLAEQAWNELVPAASQ